MALQRPSSRQLVPFVAILALWAVLAERVGHTLALTHGSLAYALDDTYIHMAIARHLAEHGVWGLTADGFTSAASSLAWPTLIALVDRVAGVSLWTPLLLNAVLAAGLVVLLDRILGAGDRPMNAWARLAVILAVLALTPVPVNVLLGMEHVLQTLVVLAAAWLAARLATDDALWARRGARLGLLALTALLPAVRYEGLALVGAIALLMAVRRSVPYAIAASASALALIGPFGLYAMRQGWYFLPNSVLVKSLGVGASSPAAVVGLFKRGFGQLLWSPHLLAPMLIVAALVLGSLRADGLRRPSQAFGALFLLTAWAHMMVGAVGWYYRYEAYLVAWGLTAIAVGVHDLATRASGERRVRVRGVAIAAVALTTAFLAAPTFANRLGSLVGAPAALVSRAVDSWRSVPGTADERFRQQVQMGRFMARYYTGRGVAANDVGAINFYATVHCMDLVGLADLDVYRLARSGDATPRALAALAHRRGMRVAVVYEDWFGNGMPPTWTRVGRWRRDGYEGISRGTVSFFALEPDERAPLAAHLKDFAPSLPPDVRLVLDPPFAP